MLKICVAILTAGCIFSPLSAMAHAGHEHGKPHAVVTPPPPPPQPAQPDNTQIEMLKTENAQLKLELENQKNTAAMMIAKNETDRSANRSSLIIVGILLMGAGLAVKYLPERGQK